MDADVEDIEKPEQTELDFNLLLPDDAGDMLLGEMSDVSEHAISGEAEREKVEISKMYDRDGNTFDPTIHVTTPDGSPVLNVDKTIKKKRGIKAGAKKSTVSSGIVEPVESVASGSREAGIVASNLLITLGCTLGGDEWQPITSQEHGINEQKNLEKAFGDYFEATGRTDFPPGMALGIAVSGYILPRVRLPQTKSKLKRFMEWGYFKFKGLGFLGKLKQAPKTDEEEEK